MRTVLPYPHHGAKVTVPFMTPEQIHHQLVHAGAAVMALEDLAALYGAARLAAAQLPVRWEFEPGTPAEVVDYLAGGAQGAASGASLGLAAEIVLAALFPGIAFGYALVGGAVIGAIRGANAIQQGWRLRWVEVEDGLPLLEVQRMAA
jgi:hypothetical protein